MRDPADTVTADLLPSPKRRGRPKTGKAMTPAERKREQRNRDQGKISMLLDAPHKIPRRVLVETLQTSNGSLAFAAWLELGERTGWITPQTRREIMRMAET